MSRPPDMAPTRFAVTPLQDVVATFDVREVAVLRIELHNEDGSQTVNAYVRSRAWVSGGDGTMPMGYSDRTELVGVVAGDTKGLDVECGGAMELDVMAASSGVGCNVLLATRRASGR